eukprot:TRINITY_DN2842_c0_g1_i2.p1 TRINITY_DN2842_c0_g1~~TRINITY_DN2842_c0_g1_i2.p1  ORF type:complete len:344 (+),score=60.74 TRINITY_DN2842_c0_g1_i2:754-1785(+)
MKAGKKDGQGCLKKKEEGSCYEGEWKEDKRDGTGVISYNSSLYTYSGVWKGDLPELIPNKLLFINERMDEYGENVSMISKPDAKKAGPDAVVEKPSMTTFIFELCGKPIDIELQIVYQGPDYEDQNKPTPEQIDEMVKQVMKDQKKGGKRDPKEIQAELMKPKMLTPDPIIVTAENGRVITFELIQVIEEFGKDGKKIDEKQKKTRLDYREDISNLRDEIARRKAEMEKEAADAAAAGTVVTTGTKKPDPKKKDNKANIAGQNQILDTRILLYKAEEVKTLDVLSHAGIVSIKGLEFPEDFPVGKYLLTARDSTTPSVVPGEFTAEINVIPLGGLLAASKKKK